LHLWNDEKEAERVVRALADSGLNFEAKLVRSEPEYVSSLLRDRFNIILVDCRADFGRAGTDQLSAYEIALEVAPHVPFLLIDNPTRDENVQPRGGKTPLFLVPRQELHLLGALI